MTAMQCHYRAAVIGHTGRGNYGHGLDTAFLGMPNIRVVAVADLDDEGRAAAQQRVGAPAAYRNYREMLVRERPDIVVVAPRWVGERVAMIEAAAAGGAHVFVEKPLAGNLADADAILRACERSDVKIAVSHQGALHPATLHAIRLVRNGDIGRLRLIRGYGKMDHRGGGQDLMILGTHVLDLMLRFTGDAQWASGDVLVGSRLAGPSDIRPGDEEIGPIAGDGLRATFGFPHDVIGMFETFARLGMNDDLFGLELVGETGQLSLRGEPTKRLFRYPHPYILPGAPDDRWEVIPVPGALPGDVPGGERPSDATLFQRANQRLVLDFLAAIEEGREPVTSGGRARAALALIQAVAAAHKEGGRIDLPLAERGHPFETFETADCGEKWRSTE